MSKNVLVISPTFPYPLTSGNRARIYELLLNLKKLGHEVYFLYINTEPFDESQLEHNHWSNKTYIAPYKPPHRTLTQRIYRKLKRMLGKESSFIYSIDSWYDKSLNRFITNLSNQIKFDVVIVEYVFFSKSLECFGSEVLKIVDTHDVYTNRHRIYLENNQYPHWYSTTQEEESKGLNRADVVVAIQQKEKEFFSKLTHKKVVTIGHTVLLQKPIQQQSFDPVILFIGSSTPMNIKGINSFLQEVLPQVRLHYPKLQLILAGTICETVPDVDHCIKLGKVSHLKEVYDRAYIVINPIPYGTGLKIKTIEALGYAKPLVTTSVGAEGLEKGSDRAFLVADTPGAFAQAIIRILDDTTFADLLSSYAYDFAKQWNENHLQELADILSN